MKKVVLRRFPWPYRAALAISNDCDYLSLDVMLHLHRLFKSEEAEGGLGLEISDSFFFYQNRSRYPNYSYFDYLSNRETAAAPVIRQLLRTGHLDATHGLGDFEAGGFKRKLTERAVEECERHGLEIPIWTNHGGFSNWQNIGRKEFATYHAGDDFNSPYFHLDLIYRLGVRYFWTDVSKTKKISLRPTGPVAAENERKPRSVVWVWPVRRIQENYELRWNYERRDVLEIVEARSGTRLQGFVRYDGFFPDGDCGLEAEELLLPDGVRAGPNIGRIAISLRPSLLNELVSDGGCCFLYQHFSTLAHVPARVHMSAALEFHPENLDALRALKRYEDEGKVWVAAQAVLLDYIYLLNTAEIRLRRKTDERDIYQLTQRKGYQFRGAHGVTFALEHGISRVEQTRKEVVLETPDGRTQVCETVGPDENGRTWCRVPIRRLPSVDWKALALEANLAMAPEISVTLLSGRDPVNLTMPARI